MYIFLQYGGRVADHLLQELLNQASSLALDAALEDGISDRRCLPGSKRHGDRYECREHRYSCFPLFLHIIITLFCFLIRMPFLLGQGNLKKLLTKMNLMNPNSTIVYFGYYGGVVEKRRRPDCLEWSLLFTRRALYQCPREGCCWTLARGRSPSRAVLHEAALCPGGLLFCPPRNKVVAAVAQQPVRHLSLPDLAGCCPEYKKFDFALSE
jgi:hypothetical protein